VGTRFAFVVGRTILMATLQQSEQARNLETLKSRGSAHFCSSLEVVVFHQRRVDLLVGGLGDLSHVLTAQHFLDAFLEAEVTYLTDLLTAANDIVADQRNSR
jgi:hypothetical protein